MDDLLIRRNYNIFDIMTRSQEDDNGIKKIEGHPVVFEQTTDIGGYFYEVIDRGAFDECDLTDVLLFVNHNQNKIPLARSRRNNGNSTMHLQIDNIGLFMSADIDIDNNPEARALYSAIKRGDLDGMSFAFRIKEQEWLNLDTKMPTRRIKKFAKLYEVSAVNKPAYESTDINARDKDALENAKRELDSARSQELDNSADNLELEKEQFKFLKITGGINNYEG
ncbi:Phage prohead protease, HK97 family [human gut metagenome]|jgi:HK97 family phage prohead protease|uniref:Phage prohead protease, HK97 family n=1 Tax=human gut metagenome TaxID=408170 RepID=W1WMH6_9ZZZZ|nr:HK97 family phage prohead protease [Intestinibacter bartlettii]SCI40430.1 phage prohead protease%2C HK97 family [uncultured Clostridium sp.]